MDFFILRIWSNADQKRIPESNYLEWGWKIDGGVLSPLWMTQPEAGKACPELRKCGCKEKCGKRCGCKKIYRTCTELCRCGGGC